jgi:hypothetical protein
LRGGGTIDTPTPNYPRWRSTFSVHQVCLLSAHVLIAIADNHHSATSTTVERVFSQGRQLLSFTRNCLSPLSIRSIMCFGDWGRKDLVDMPDLIEAIGGKKSKKRALEDESSIEIIA